MRISTMRFLDSRVGPPLCFLLTLLRRLRPGRSAVGPLQAVLLIKFWGMGSLICAAPLAGALRTRHPQARLDVLTFPSQRETVDLLGIADRALTIETASLGAFLRSTARTLGAIRRNRYSAVIDLEFFSKFTAIVSYLSRAPVRIGFQFRPIYRGDLFTHAVPFNDRLHIIRVFRSLGRPLGVADAPALYPRIEPPAEAAASAAAKLGIESASSRPYVVLNPNVGDQSPELRRWDPDRFADLARRLVGEDGCAVILVGGPADVPYVRDVARRLAPLPEVVDASGRLTLPELAALLARAAAVVSSDTGPMHLAVAVGAPVVAFFGTETPTLYGPIGPEHTVIHRDLPCSPCLTVYNEKINVCRYQNVCMRSIGTEEVLAAVRSKLPRRAAPRIETRALDPASRADG